jgi:ribosomal protein S18 acetylase RimI-like enzyme
MPDIRPYRPEDLPALHRVCLRTAAHGGDASGVISDPELPGLLYAMPYLVREPDLCWVATDDSGEVAGYILGTCDSRAFADWSEREWFPPLRARFPFPPPDRQGLEETFLRILHEGYRAPSIVAEYPAHLHIDLLPSLQKRGMGRRLLQVFSDALRDRGVQGVHLGVNHANPGACAFYAKMGFQVLERHETWSEMGLKLVIHSSEL